MQLQGYHAVITGAARGMGAAAARRFVTEGARVVVADIDGAAARACALEIDPAGKLAGAFACEGAV